MVLLYRGVFFPIEGADRSSMRRVDITLVPISSYQRLFLSQASWPSTALMAIDRLCALVLCFQTKTASKSLFARSSPPFSQSRNIV
ncbi:hypothetical protein LWI29_017703 [Acer saccharum]|uniref:Uncharacterized protein n=1 Tax=Acer saccharum TaxID=4024 RepID=A0AA39S8C1_ACESA|nr:hypothetical protein LWI29_017703 [Acer saccharum]